MNKRNKDLKSLLTPAHEKSYMVSLLNSHEFKSVLRRYGRVFTRILFAGPKVQSRLLMLTKFGDMLLRITKFHGPVFTVKYLKALTVALQRFIGGQPLSSLREIEPDLPLPRLASCGLPSFIPLRERAELKRLTPSVVRWWLTIFSIYRIISIPGKMKLETITAPYGGNKDSLLQVSAWLFENSKQLASLFVKDFEPKASLGLEHIQKASPSSTVSWKGFLSDAKTWLGKVPFFQFANFGQFSLYYDWFELIKLLDKEIPAEVPQENCKHGADPASRMPLGQLALKEEAAGKIRVFAMVDIWTQSVLKPLHNWLFDFFRKLPNDSTHNQDVGFLRAKEKATVAGHAWCYDLSAATDRLPIQLQIAILDSFFGHIPCSGHDTGASYGQAWAALLTDRDYVLPKSHLNDEVKTLRYAVGQPMGAYSSWAMLNLCHHLLLQYICISIYKKVKWYECYEVLGDDIVIFDEEVAKRYLMVMEGWLDVKCNQSKSLLAPHRPVIEFAKRVSIGKEEVSAFSWRQIRSFDSLIGRSCVAADIVSRRGVKSPLRAFKAITGPSWGPIPSYQYSLISFAGILVNRGILTFNQLATFLVDPKNPLRFIGGRIIANVRVGVLEQFMIKYSRGETLPIPKIDFQSLGRLFQLNQAAARGYMEDRIVDLHRDLEVSLKNRVTELQESFDRTNGIGRLIPESVILSLFYPGGRYRHSVKLVDLSSLSFEELVDRVDKLEQILREYQFYKLPVTRGNVMEDSFKLLRIISKSRKRGSLSFERTL